MMWLPEAIEKNDDQTAAMPIEQTTEAAKIAISIRTPIPPKSARITEVVRIDT